MVSVLYHIGGKRVINNGDCKYEGGELFQTKDIDPDEINLMDLIAPLQREGNYNTKFKLYYEEPDQSGVDGFVMIVNDDSIRSLLLLYDGKEIYDIYVEVDDDGFQNTREGIVNRVSTHEVKDEAAPKLVETRVKKHNEDLETQHSDDDDDRMFGDITGISDDELEEVEEIRKKVKEVKERLKKGISLTYLDSQSDPDIVQPNLNKDHGNNDEGEEGFRSDEIGSYDDTDGEDDVADGGLRRNSRLISFNTTTDTPYFELGMSFTAMNEVRKAITDHSIQEKKKVILKQNDTKRIRAVCAWNGCKWTLLVSWDKAFERFRVKTYKPHSCPLHYRNKRVGPKFIAEKYKRRIRSDPRWKLRDMMETIKEETNFSVNYMTCSRAKAAVLKTTEGCYKDEYGLLRTYAEEILHRNLDSTVKLMVDTRNPEQKPLFQRMYVCFGALKKGFLLGCRKILGLDGCFLKGLCKGELLAAVGRDANDQMYPVAWAVVEVESRSSWDWFLTELSNDLAVGNGDGWTFCSDQMKGLVPAIANMFPEATHRLSARHIFCNWRKKF